jgi:hypothetical protein
MISVDPVLCLFASAGAGNKRQNQGRCGLKIQLQDCGTPAIRIGAK